MNKVCNKMKIKIKIKNNYKFRLIHYYNENNRKIIIKIKAKI